MSFTIKTAVAIHACQADGTFAIPIEDNMGFEGTI